LVLFHVTHLPPGLGPETLISHEETGELVPVGSFARKGARYRLAEVAGPLRAQGLTVATRAAIGDTAEEILAVAKSEAIDLIVMGTHGRHGLRHILLGSIAEKIIRQATVPVLTVRSEGEATPTAEELRLADEGAG
ncbi:MAG: universal stress protein, partial [Myxococcales bacterium]|nr:universal stress protein [Myxococcales bacterium]